MTPDEIVEAVATIEIWVVHGDNHDYDYMSQWFVGVYASEEDANLAAKADAARYHKENPGSKKNGLPNHDIDSTIFGSGLAKAAILAVLQGVREPTSEMLNAPGVDAGERTMRKAWQAMIDHLLSGMKGADNG